MRVKLHYLLFSIFLTQFCSVFGQNVNLYNQFSGQYDFTFIGNTMNLGENNTTAGCEDLLVTSSSADLNLNSNQNIIAAYLYWAGSGDGDFTVKLNNVDITAERSFTNVSVSSNLTYFSAFANVTAQLITTGNGTYTLSDLDISETLTTIPGYCNNRTNFSGWAIALVYEDASFLINQINIYDGLQSIPPSIDILLNSLNVIDNVAAKIGFIAWEGDSSLAVNETLRINGNVLSNPPLNPNDNAFNGTNSVTGSSTLYDLDLDIYDIQNNINVGDTTALIQLTSGQDVVLINTIITKLNSQLPDATVVVNQVQNECNSRTIIVDYTVSNLNSTAILQAGTPISIYANGIFIGFDETTMPIAIGESVNIQIFLNIPATIPINFTLLFVVDDTGNGTGIVNEIIETNNTFLAPFSLLVSPEFNMIPNVFSCVSSIENTVVDFSNYSNLVSVNPTDVVQFFTTFEDANNNINAIINTSKYSVNQPITTIYIRLDNDNCFSITSFDINLILFPDFVIPNNLTICKENESATFDFSVYSTTIPINPADVVTFYNSIDDANNLVNAIQNSNNYLPNTTPKEIFVRIENEHCYSTTSFFIDYYELPTFNLLENLISCNEGLTQGTFDFESYAEVVKTNPLDITRFYSSMEDAINLTDEINNTNNYIANVTPTQIFVRIDNENCTNYTSFSLFTKNCPPTVYNYVSANNDTFNDSFHADGLRDIFLKHQIYIYNRWGKLVWTGNNNTPEWTGFSNKDVRLDTSNSPKGTYFYIIYLNDENYPQPLQGFLYLTR